MCFAPQRRSGPNVRCFELFHLQMCFAPQRRCSEREVLLAFSLANVLCATTACTFWTAQLPRVLRSWSALYILTWKCASRHNGVQFFISHLASWLRTRCFSEPTIRPSGATNQWKNTVFRNFPTFSRTWIFFLRRLSLLIFFLLLFSSLTLSISAYFHLSMLSEIWLLNFLRYPSIIFYVVSGIYPDISSAISSQFFWRTSLLTIIVA